MVEDMISIPVPMLRELQQTVQRQANTMQQQANTMQQQANTISTMGEQMTKMNLRIEELTQMLRNANRARFGQNSEQTIYVYPQNGLQLSMFDTPVQDDTAAVEEPVAEETAEEPVAVEVKGHTRKKKRTMEQLIELLPQEIRVIDLPEEEKVNAEGQPLICIGQEYVRTEITLKREEAHAVKIYRKTYSDKRAEMQDGETRLTQAPVPEPLIPHSYASPSLVTSVLVKKYMDGLPLYRQEQIWKRIGLPLSRTTMASWAIGIAERYLEPMWRLFRQELLKQTVIHADETVIQVLKEEGKAPSSESRIWVYASGKHAPVQIRCFDYQTSRRRECAERFLEGFHGVLVSDGYSGYIDIRDVTRAGCWAHMRRKWREAMPAKSEMQRPERHASVTGYNYCTQLFMLEREFAEMTPEERKEARQQKSKPLLERYKNWLDSLPRTDGKLKKAVTYAQNQWPYLCAFLEHGDMEISNNQVENAIRPFVIGRKGWLFSDTPQGAHASGIVYSLIETAKANHLNVELYLLHVLTVLQGRSDEEIAALVPALVPWDAQMQSGFGN